MRKLRNELRQYLFIKVTKDILHEETADVSQVNIENNLFY